MVDDQENLFIQVILTFTVKHFYIPNFDSNSWKLLSMTLILHKCYKKTCRKAEVEVFYHRLPF